ncbi:hypothetical protein J2T09_003897 [Neorhizobium huautlense]|uniref:RTX toxin n=1 Tax=Neorhizobium huautlense TaxID=67774 RepID=A0ABT9PXI3_9HYPH|nr:RTX toxin [Neorhizobium huautlense]MDP9839122.1 hypothetical protein [Neorhizobium huautlense]
MVSINAFYRSSNAGQYASQLFGNNRPSSAPSTWSNTSSSTYVPGESAAEKAISRIVEILTLGNADSDDQASVSESFGYITHARGTEGDDTLTFAGRSVSNVEAGAGNDSIIAKTTTASSIDGGDGDDQLKLAARFINDITGGTGDDTIEISAKTVLAVDGGGGNDTLKVAADTVLGLTGGDGDDKIHVESKRLSVSGGTGNDTVTFNIRRGGSAEYLFARGDGTDTIASNGALTIVLTGYTPAELSVMTSNNRMVVTFEGSQDKLTLDFTDGALEAGQPKFGFSTENGALSLWIR